MTHLPAENDALRRQLVAAMRQRDQLKEQLADAVRLLGDARRKLMKKYAAMEGREE